MIFKGEEHKLCQPTHAHEFFVRKKKKTTWCQIFIPLYTSSMECSMVKKRSLCETNERASKKKWKLFSSFFSLFPSTMNNGQNDDHLLLHTKTQSWAPQRKKSVYCFVWFFHIISRNSRCLTLWKARRQSLKIIKFFLIDKLAKFHRHSTKRQNKVNRYTTTFILKWI